jgi:hypothetical protein
MCAPTSATTTLLIIEKAIKKNSNTLITSSPILPQIPHKLKVDFKMLKLGNPYAIYYELKMQQIKHLKAINTLWFTFKIQYSTIRPKVYVMTFLMAHIKPMEFKPTT